MNIKVLLSLCIMVVAVAFNVGCEVQEPATHPDSAHSELEESVSVFASSIDPYETYSRTEIYAMLEEFMYAHPEVYGSGFALVGVEGQIQDFYYIYKDGTTFITYDGFDYGSVDKGVMQALQQQVAQGEQFWSKEYSREDSSGRMITVSSFLTPILMDSGNVKYVFTVDQIEETE